MRVSKLETYITYIKLETLAFSTLRKMKIHGLQFVKFDYRRERTRYHHSSAHECDIVFWEGLGSRYIGNKARPD